MRMSSIEQERQKKRRARWKVYQTILCGCILHFEKYVQKAIHFYEKRAKTLDL